MGIDALPVVDEQLGKLIPFLFQTLEGLHFAVNNFPATWPSHQIPPVTNHGSSNLVIGFDLEAGQYMILRSAISLAGDAFLLCRTMKKLNSGELASPLDTLFTALEKYWPIRNAFTHLDERVTLKKHLLNGSARTDCGIVYGAASRDSYHLVLADNHIHFLLATAVPDKIGVTSADFAGIFSAAREVYSILISHRLHRGFISYIEPAQVFT